MTCCPPGPAAPLEQVSLDPLDTGVDWGPWRDLAMVALDPNPFFGPDFLVPYLANMTDAAVRLAVVREATTGRWLAAAPIGRRRPGLVMPMATVWASEYSPLGTPLLHPDAGPQVFEDFFSQATADNALLAIPYLALNSQTADRLRSCAEPTFARVAERAAHDGGKKGETQFAQAFSGKRRKELPRQLRRLGERGAVRFESLTGARAVDGFERFLSLEAAGWKGAAGTALLDDPASATFARQVIGNRAARNGVRIDQLLLGEQVVAALVLFLEGSRAFSWKIAFDEAYARYSPGAQVTLHALEQNLRTPGLAGADSLAVPGHRMIEPLWRGRIRTGTMLMARGPAARLRRMAGLADLAAEQRLRHLARRVLHRSA